jgi:hypothetical protein
MSELFFGMPLGVMILGALVSSSLLALMLVGELRAARARHRRSRFALAMNEAYRARHTPIEECMRADAA